MRSRKVIVFCGQRETGKTTQLLNMVRSQNQRVLIYDVNGEQKYLSIQYLNPKEVGTFTGVRKIYSSNIGPFFTWIEEKYRNGLLVLEDASAYVDFRIDGDLNSFLVKCRHKGIDIAMTFHSLARIPVKVYDMTNTLVLFKTTENPAKALNKLPMKDAILEAFERVKKHPNKHYYEIIQLS